MKRGKGERNFLGKKFLSPFPLSFHRVERFTPLPLTSKTFIKEMASMKINTLPLTRIEVFWVVRVIE